MDKSGGIILEYSSYGLDDNSLSSRSNSSHAKQSHFKVWISYIGVKMWQTTVEGLSKVNLSIIFPWITPSYNSNDIPVLIVGILYEWWLPSYYRPQHPFAHNQC